MVTRLAAAATANRRPVTLEGILGRHTAVPADTTGLCQESPDF
jgi:hypothetical protein